MILVYRPDNSVDLALAESLLTDAGIPYYVQNKNFSSLYPGAAIDLFSACAVMVPDEAETVAFGILSDLIATQEENAKAGGKASSLSVSSIDRELDQAPLGKHSAYIEHYDASLLFPIPRAGKRTEIGIATDAPLPFFGNDVWNAYELSWLEPGGKPRVALASFTLPATSPNIIESKSLKLYLNSFNQSIFASEDAMREAVQRDLSQAAGAEVAVVIISSTAFGDQQMGHFEGFCLDDLAIDTDIYTPSPEFLKVDANADAVNETLVSHLLKSNCLVTGQPDWGSVQITYTGRPIDRAGLLKYIISLRRHNEFHEQCVERMFMNVMAHCAPERLSVYARYTRRGGLDINPFRASHADMPLPENRRLARQ